MEPKLHKISKIFKSSKSNFYAKHWKTEPDVFSDVPFLYPKNLSDTPLDNRLYKSDKGMVKIVTNGENKFLIKRPAIDLAKDPLLIDKNSLALVIFINPDEGVERSLHCYENNVLPYIGDINNPMVSVMCAEQFGVNAFICDMSSLKLLSEKKIIPESVKKVVVYDSGFEDLELLSKVSDEYDLKLFLSIPETGVLANVEFEVETGDLRLKELDEVLLECIDGGLVVSKLNLCTPLVRYVANIACINNFGQITLVN